MAEGLEIQRESKLVNVQREFGVWELTIENRPAWRVGRLVLTAPLPQSLALLKAGAWNCRGCWQLSWRR